MADEFDRNAVATINDGLSVNSEWMKIYLQGLMNGFALARIEKGDA